MDFSLSFEQLQLRDTARTLMRRIATPDHVRQLDRDKAYPHALYDAWIEAGFLAAPFPEEYGGLGLTLTDAAIIAEELSRTSADFVMHYALGLFCGLNVLRNGTDAQKKRWLPQLLSGEIKFSIGMSEPNAGSDLGSIRTSAVKNGDHYVINGIKTWQTGAAAPRNVINLYARTRLDGDIRGGLSMLLVPSDLPGIAMTKLDLMGRYCTGTYEVRFTDVRVPADNLIGRENEGWAYLLSGLSAERAVVSACDCGSAAAVLDTAVTYAQDRRQFGRPIGTYQAVAHMLADAQTEVAAAQALMARAIWAAETESPDALRDVTMAKLFASETYVKAANVAMQVFGGNGYSNELDVQRHYRDCRIATVVAGTSEIMREIIASQTRPR